MQRPSFAPLRLERGPLQSERVQQQALEPEQKRGLARRLFSRRRNQRGK
jgi:hypothetical protein